MGHTYLEPWHRCNIEGIFTIVKNSPGVDKKRESKNKMQVIQGLFIYMYFWEHKLRRDWLTLETMILQGGANGYNTYGNNGESVSEITLVLYRYWGQHWTPLFHEWSLDNDSLRKQPLIEWYRKQEKGKTMSMNNDMTIVELLLLTSSIFSEPFSLNVRMANDGEIISLLRRKIFTMRNFFEEKKNLMVDINK